MSIAQPEPVGAGRGGDDAAADPSRDRLSTLARISHALVSPLDIEAAFRVVYAELAEVVDAAIFILGIHDEPTQMIHVVRQVYDGVETARRLVPARQRLHQPGDPHARAAADPALVGRGPPIRVRYASGEGKTPESGLTVPLVAGEHVLGVLLVQSYEPEAYDERDLLMVQAIGRHARGPRQRRGSEQLDAQLQPARLGARGDPREHERRTADPRPDRLRRAAEPGRARAPQRRRHQHRPRQAARRQQWEHWPPGPRAVAQALAPAAGGAPRGALLRDAEVDLARPERRVLGFSCAPIHDLDGGLAGGVVVFRDVTGRREVERLKDEVLSIASHDLQVAGRGDQGPGAAHRARMTRAARRPTT